MVKLKWLAFANQDRGRDSTGVYGNHLFKEKGRAEDVILMPGFNAAVKGAKTIQGHTRAASVGSISKENAHPFHFGINDEHPWKASVVGSHNGFIVDELRRFYEKKYAFEKFLPVDSQILFSALAQTGDVRVISEIEGGMAISFQFLNDNPNKLYLYKREETRPLYIGEAADGLYYSSLDRPLKFIGCRNVWNVIPNLLYTLEDGEITDIFKMPPHTLKSMAVNVSRGNWRQGIPAAELNALPDNVGSQARLLARTNATPGNSGGTNSQMGFGHNFTGFSKHNTEARVSKEYTNKNSLDYKFNMLIHNVNKIIETLEIDPLSTDTVTTSREADDLSSCVLCINIVSGDHKKGLPAWAVYADGDKDLAGITGGNGLTVIKVPVSKCDKPVKLIAYAPVQEFGPYSFTVTPEAARVMEVTLSIPFLKKGRKKEVSTGTNGGNESIKSGSGAGQTSCSVYAMGPQPAEVHVTGEEQNCCSLREHPAEVSGGSEGQQAHGVLFKQNPYEHAIPVTADDLPAGLNLKERVKNTIPRLQPENVAITMIGVALAKDNYGCWSNMDKMPGSIKKWATELPERERWLDYYQRNHMTTIKVAELILHATRLMERDRWVTHVWFPFWVYIEVLLKLHFAAYVRDSFSKHSVSLMNRVSFYPSTAIKAGFSADGGEVTTKKKSLTGPILVLDGFFNWLNAIDHISKITPDKMKALHTHYQNLIEHIVRLNELVAEGGHNDNLTTAQKNDIINVRNFLRLERSDLHDYMEVAKTHLPTEKGVMSTT